MHAITELLDLIGWSAFAFSLTVATPVELARKALHISNSDRPTNEWQHFFQELANCSHCLGFWVGACAYGSLAGGGLVFLGAKLIDALWSKLPIKTNW